jgi:PilZ domain-containing protein
MKRQKKSPPRDSSLENDVGTERRRKPRIFDPFPAKVKGTNLDGESFETETVIDNLSADGLYLRLMQRVKQGAKLSVVFQLSLKPGAEAVSQPRVAVKGLVLRTESKPGGVFGVAITFDRARFLFA